MLKIFFVIALSCMTLLLSSSLFSQNDSFTALLALEGNWGMETKKGMLYESWKKMNDSTLGGRSYRMNGNDTMLLEEMLLAVRGGSLYFIPTVQGQNNQQAISFLLTGISAREYQFENPEHDFPQKVIYRLPAGNELHARIEGISKGQPAKQEFNYRKIE